MVQRCKKCGAKIIKFPLLKWQEDGIPFSWDGVLWLNLFKVDWYTLMWLAVILILMVTYNHDIAECNKIITDPLKYCEESNACKIIEERESENPYGIIVLDNGQLTKHN